MTACRLIVDQAAPGVCNMAVDETLLQSAAEQQQPTLRFYMWQPATLSLGYFQRLSDRQLHSASKECDVVRRASGGGAILHDRELTYCLATPSRNRFQGFEQLYRAFHESLVEVLTQAGIAAQLHPDGQGFNEHAFLCFQRRASGDVILDNHKIGGSAQRRWRNALVQQGSILLEKSEFAPEVPGLRDLSNYDVPTDWLVQAWTALLGPRLNLAFQPGELSDKERINEARLASEKFECASWTARR